MNPFRYKNVQVEFGEMTGIVVAANKYSETHVSSYGGGGTIKDGSGHISAPHIESTVLNKQEFWLRADSGEEVPIKLINNEIAIHDGQKITGIIAKRSSNGYWVIFYNHNANRYWFIYRGYQLIDKFNITRGFGWHKFALIFFIFAIPISGWAASSSLQPIPLYIFIGFIIAAIYPAIDFIRLLRERNRIANSLDKHMWSVFNETIDGMVTQSQKKPEEKTRDISLSIVKLNPLTLEKFPTGTKLTIPFDVENKGNAVDVQVYIEFRVLTTKVDGQYSEKIFNTKPTLREKIPGKSVKSCKVSFFFASPDVPLVEPPNKVKIELRP